MPETHSTPVYDGGQESIATRQTLLERMKDWGSQTSWREFFETYWRLIYNVAIKAGLSDAEAQEVVQETVIAVAKKIGDFKTDPGRGSFSAWLMRLTRWRIADQFRKRQSATRPVLARDLMPPNPDDTGPSDPLDHYPDGAGESLEAVWSREWETHLVAAALEQVKQQVSAGQFQIFDLHVIQGLPARDTARTLQVSVASVYMAKSRVFRALKAATRRVREGRK